jgi:hypothetical protein
MIPLILGAVALGTAAVGAMKSSEGIGNMNEAKKIGEVAQKRYDRAVSQLKAEWEATNKLPEEYGQLQLKVKTCTIGRFVAFIERIGQRASQSELRFLEGLDISTQQIKEYKTTAIEAEDWVKGSVSAVVAGAAAGSGAVTLARSVGTVTVTRFFGLWATEVGISQLGGAAARNATIAWLGGSSMAVGGLVLGGITLGPALMVGGFQLAKTPILDSEGQLNPAAATIQAKYRILGGN